MKIPHAILGKSPRGGYRRRASWRADTDSRRALQRFRDGALAAFLDDCLVDDFDAGWRFADGGSESRRGRTGFVQLLSARIGAAGHSYFRQGLLGVAGLKGGGNQDSEDSLAHGFSLVLFSVITRIGDESDADQACAGRV